MRSETEAVSGPVHSGQVKSRTEKEAVSSPVRTGQVKSRTEKEAELESTRWTKQTSERAVPHW